MDYRRINSHIILLGVVAVAGLFAAIIVRMSMLGHGADAGTANLIFVLILAASAVLYLVIIATLAKTLIPWIMRRLPTPKKGLRTADKGISSEEEKGVPVIVSLTSYAPVTPTMPPMMDWGMQRERELSDRLLIFKEYTHFVMGSYVSESELARLDEYVELFAREAALPQDFTPIKTERLKNPDLYHWGWNIQNYFKVGKREDVVPWLQRVFAPLRDLEFSTIKGKLHDGYTQRHTIPNIDDIPKFITEKHSYGSPKIK